RRRELERSAGRGEQTVVIALVFERDRHDSRHAHRWKAHREPIRCALEEISTRRAEEDARHAREIEPSKLDETAAREISLRRLDRRDQRPDLLARRIDARHAPREHLDPSLEKLAAIRRRRKSGEVEIGDEGARGWIARRGLDEIRDRGVERATRVASRATAEEHATSVLVELRLERLAIVRCDPASPRRPIEVEPRVEIEVDRADRVEASEPLAEVEAKEPFVDETRREDLLVAS